METNRLIPLSEIASQLGISLPTVRKIIASGKLRSLDLNGRPRVRQCHLDDFLKAAERPAVQP